MYNTSYINVSYLRGYQEGKCKKYKRRYLDEVTSLARFSKSRYGSTHTTHINNLYREFLVNKIQDLDILCCMKTFLMCI
jgi:hypothetical protein